jgi:Zn-dependent protease with chaperone function
MPYNRALETEADKVGLELAAKVCHINKGSPILLLYMHFITWI